MLKSLSRQLSLPLSRICNNGLKKLSKRRMSPVSVKAREKVEFYGPRSRYFRQFCGPSNPGVAGSALGHIAARGVGRARKQRVVGIKGSVVRTEAHDTRAVRGTTAGCLVIKSATPNASDSLGVRGCLPIFLRGELGKIVGLLLAKLVVMTTFINSKH